MDLFLAVIEIVFSGGVAVAEVIDAAAHGPEEFLVAALQRAEVRRKAEVPLADERGRIAGVAQERGQGRMSGRQPEVWAAAPDAAGDRLGGGAAQPVLPAPGGQRKTRRRAHRRVRIAVGKSQSFCRETVEIRRARRAAAVAPEG